MGTRDLLERWRPSATPGAPSLAGVPADRVAERGAELEPLWARLAGVQAEVDQICAEARAEADRRRDAAAEQARSLIAQAQRSCAAERASAAATARAMGAESAQRIGDQALEEARAVAARSHDREPAVVAEIVALARQEIAALVQAES